MQGVRQHRVPTETKQSSSKTVNVCTPVTGGLTIGYWQNKNGQAQITNAGSVAPTTVCKLTSSLRTYAPFQDLANTSTCAQVAIYVTNVVKAANASGAAMNAMLKAQMLATALSVYFTPTLGTTKIDLTQINKPIGSSTYENVKDAFGGALSLTVNQMLTYAGQQYIVPGGSWYGQVKATQELAKDAFDAINNNVAFVAP